MHGLTGSRKLKYAIASGLSILLVLAGAAAGLGAVARWRKRRGGAPEGETKNIYPLW